MPTDARAAYHAIVAQLTDEAPAVIGTMFGMPCLKVGGKVLAGFHQEAVVFKLDGATALELPGARPFDPGMGRPTRQWVFAPPEHSDRWLALGQGRRCRSRTARVHVAPAFGFLTNGLPVCR